MKRLWWLGLVLATSAVFGQGLMVSSASAAPPPPCASGFFSIQNNHTGTYLTGNGVNAPLTLGSGNCFKAISEGGGTYSWQNAAGHCIWWDAATFTFDLGLACAGRVNEIMVPVSSFSGGFWTVATADSGPWYWNTTDSGCVNGSTIDGDANQSTSTCDRFKAFG